MKKNLPKFIFAFAFLSLAIFLHQYGLEKYFNLEYIKSNQLQLVELYQQDKATFLLSYFVIYVALTMISLPGASTLLTLAGGAIFGFWTTLVTVSFASSIGATLAFLSSRYLFRDFIQDKFGKYLEKINKGFEKDGAFYLFTIRVVPIFPFFIVNVLMGLTPIKVSSFYFYSQIGMILGSAVYTNAGVEISKIESVRGILSPSLFLSFLLLGILPFLGKWIVKKLKPQAL